MSTLVPAAVLSLFAGAALGQFTTPNVINTSSPVVSNLNGTTFVNRGLVGVGRMPAFLDAQGSTFGSVSSLAMAPGSWGYDPATNRYSGQFLTLPDRGRNDPATGNFVNYQGRVQKVDFSFSPLYAGNGASQNQISFDYRGLTLLSESDGRPLVGNDPGTGTGTAFGRPVPRVGGAGGNIALDAEGLVALPDGGYYVSDEYGSAIYRFDAAGTMLGLINPPAALMPRNAQGNLNFNSVTPPTTGRRNNQGMEGLSLSPDGRYLFAMNQSGAVQDSAGSNQSNRRFTRVMVYDISQEATPETPVGQYVVELPTTRSTGDGAATDRTAAQSEIVAISNTQFMVLSRDSNGRGPGTGLTPIYKSVLLADISGATNLVGTEYSNLLPISTAGNLAAGITPASKTEALNMLNLFDLDRFGINLGLSAANPNGDINTLSEKWEGMSLVPDVATADPTDFFLFIANDNDFLTANGVMHTTDGQTITYNDGFENDTMFLVYKVSIPAPGAASVLVGAMLLASRRRR